MSKEKHGKGENNKKAPVKNWKEKRAVKAAGSDQGNLIHLEK
jgi:hypothetical protein